MNGSLLACGGVGRCVCEGPSLPPQPRLLTTWEADPFSRPWMEFAGSVLRSALPGIHTYLDLDAVGSDSPGTGTGAYKERMPA